MLTRGSRPRITTPARHDLAAVNFEQAVALTRRHEGLLTERQLSLLAKYIDSLTQLGRYEDALQAQRYVLRIETRKYGESGIGLVPTLEQIGAWYARVGAYDQSRRTLRRAVDDRRARRGCAVAEADRAAGRDRGVQPPAAARPDAAARRSRAGCGARYAVPRSGGYPRWVTTRRPSCWPKARSRSNRAATIAEGRPDASLVEIADVRTQLGDWYQGRGQPERALPHYQLAWQAASKADARIEGKPLVEVLFGQPLLLQIVRPSDWNRYAERPRQPGRGAQRRRRPDGGQPGPRAAGQGRRGFRRCEASRQDARGAADRALSASLRTGPAGHDPRCHVCAAMDRADRAAARGSESRRRKTGRGGRESSTGWRLIARAPHRHRCGGTTSAGAAGAPGPTSPRAMACSWNSAASLAAASRIASRVAACSAASPLPGKALAGCDP